MKELSELFLLEYFGIKVIIATICGLIVGIEREKKDKVAGIRTNVLVCVGVAIMTAASFLYGSVDSDVDSTRIIGQIITGVGFLGAGVIFKNNDKVVGVTTASFIWIMSAIGILAGSGFILVPITLTIGLVIISLLFEKLERFVKK